MASRKMWIEVTVLEGPGVHPGTSSSDKTETYDVVPTSYELKGRLSIDVKPQFLQSAMKRIGVEDKPTPTAATRNTEAIYEPVKEGDIREDVDDMMESLTGKPPSPFVSLFGELADDLLRPGRKKK